MRKISADLGRRLILAMMLLANGLARRLKLKHRLTGKCAGCGSCCKFIVFRSSARQLASKYSLPLLVKWFSWFYGFDLVMIDRQKEFLVFTCRHLRADKSCANYFWRPPLCRNFPFRDLAAPPVFFPECGYRVKV